MIVLCSWLFNVVEDGTEIDQKEDELIDSKKVRILYDCLLLEKEELGLGCSGHTLSPSLRLNVCARSTFFVTTDA